MNEALKEARKGICKDEIPVGVVIVKNDKIVSKAHNLKVKKNNPIEHAEIIAIRRACNKLKDWRLKDCTMYVTLEPCIMCMGAIIESRVNMVVCGCKNNKYHNFIDYIKNFYKVTFECEVLEQECSEILKTFFEIKRKKN